jgi:hypothetical protein
MTLTIPADDYGQIRVFSHQGPMTDSLLSKSAGGLRQAFGTAGLNPDYIDIVDTAALDGMTLSQYLQQGYDMTATAMDRQTLDTLLGPVILVMSRASGGADMTLTLGPALRHVTTLADPAALRVPRPIPSEAATGVMAATPAQKRPSDAAMSGRIATVALVLLFVLVGVMIWIAG